MCWFFPHGRNWWLSFALKTRTVILLFSSSVSPKPSVFSFSSHLRYTMTGIICFTVSHTVAARLRTMSNFSGTSGSTSNMTEATCCVWSGLLFPPLSAFLYENMLCPCRIINCTQINPHIGGYTTTKHVMSYLNHRSFFSIKPQGFHTIQCVWFSYR